MGQAAIEIQGLEKTFTGHLSIGRIHALRGVDLSVPRGVIYGFLGPTARARPPRSRCSRGSCAPSAGP